MSHYEKVDARRKQQVNGIEQSNMLEYLRACLDDACTRLAAKFNLFDCAGRPRKAFIADKLFRFHCTGCLWKVFTQTRACNDGVDALYREMHGLAVNLLTGALTQLATGEGFNVYCEKADEYGRTDVVVKPAGFGVVVEANGGCVVVEVKTGKSLSFAQLFRYLLQRPNAVLVVWRVGKRQVFALKGGKLQTLLYMYISSAISRGLRLLKGEVVECHHNLNFDKSAVVSDPQRLLDDFFEGLAEGLPRAVSAVVKALKEAWPGAG